LGALHESAPVWSRNQAEAQVLRFISIRTSITLSPTTGFSSSIREVRIKTARNAGGRSRAALVARGVSIHGGPEGGNSCKPKTSRSAFALNEPPSSLCSTTRRKFGPGTGWATYSSGQAEKKKAAGYLPAAESQEECPRRARSSLTVRPNIATQHGSASVKTTRVCYGCAIKLAKAAYISADPQGGPEANYERVPVDQGCRTTSRQARTTRR
jgi:hypothetical protein